MLPGQPISEGADTSGSSRTPGVPPAQTKALAARPDHHAGASLSCNAPFGWASRADPSRLALLEGTDFQRTARGRGRAELPGLLLGDCEGRAKWKHHPATHSLTLVPSEGGARNRAGTRPSRAARSALPAPSGRTAGHCFRAERPRHRRGRVRPELAPLQDRTTRRAAAAGAGRPMGLSALPPAADLGSAPCHCQHVSLHPYYLGGAFISVC